LFLLFSGYALSGYVIWVLSLGHRVRPGTPPQP
jgi:hypothetical protein